MTKPICLSLALLSAVCMLAQPKKGAIYWQGNASFQMRVNTQQDPGLGVSNTASSLHLSPGFGLCFNERWVSGFSLNLSSDISSGMHSKNATTEYSSEVFLKYFMPLTKDISLYFSPQLQLEFGDYMRQSFSTSGVVYRELDIPFFRSSVSGSILFFPLPSLGLELLFSSLFYRLEKYKARNAYEIESMTTHSFGFNINPAYFRLGLVYIMK